MRRWLKKPDKQERSDIAGDVLGWLTSLSPQAILLAVFGVVTFGWLGYMILGELGPIDALYMALITISTVGFGDEAPSTVGRIFTMVYLVLGVGVFSLTLSTIASALVAGRVHEVLGRRRMERQIQNLENHLILCGFGRFGQITAGEIAEKTSDLVVIDLEPTRIDEADEEDILGVQGDATEEETLEKAGIDRARALLCTLPSDAENVYAILNARELRPDLPIVALARDRRAESKLLRAGANYVISPYVIGATHMARQILSPHLAQVFNLAAAGGEAGLEHVGVQLDEMPVGPGSSLIGHELRDSPIRSDFHVMLVAVIDSDGSRHFNPGPEHVITEGSVLVSIGPAQGLERLRAAAGGPPPTAEIEE